MLYTINDRDPGFLFFGFFDESDGLLSLDVVSETSSEIILENTSNGARVTLTGSGLSFDNDGRPDGGVLTSITVFDGATELGSVSQITWSFADFGRALDDWAADDYQRLANLVNQSSRLTVDASAATDFVDIETAFERIADLITIGMDYIDAQFDVDLVGTSGDDVFNIIGAPDDFTFIGIEATEGDDVFDGSGIEPGRFVFIDYDQDYSPNRNPITVTIDGQANTGTISTATFTDSFNTVTDFLLADGLHIGGSNQNDSFTISQVENGWLELSGGEGVDDFDLTLAEGSTIRLSFEFGASDDPAHGVQINLAAQTIADDGFGNSDTLSITNNGGRIEIAGTNNDDDITGSDGNDRFIPEQGDDTMDGGEGFDQVRYDRRGVDPVNVDLQAGTATGTWDGEAFTDRLISIESVRGSRDGNDTLRGSDADEFFDGRGGDDSLVGRGGNDELIGADGDDTLSGGDGDDYLEGGRGADSLAGGAGDDVLSAEDGDDTLRGGDGRDDLDGGDGDDLIDASGGSADSQGFGDFILPGLGQDTILGHAAHWATGEGADVFYGNLGGIGGLTITVGVDGTGTAISGDGRVNDTFTFLHFFIGSADDDSITGADEDRFEGFVGSEGDDTIDGGAGTAFVTYDGEHFEGGSTGISADLGTGDKETATGIVTDTFGDTDTLRRINEVTGSIFDDTIDAEDRTDGLRLDGGEGDDTLLGGTGNDTLFDGNGDDSLAGGVGDDVMIAGSGADTFDGGDGHDLFIVDLLDSGRLDFVVEANLATGDQGAVGNPSNRDLLIDIEDYSLFGDVDVVLTGSDEDNRLETDLGADTLSGGAGNDTLDAGAGNDTASGGLGDDLVRGGDGDDLLRGNSGEDTLEGGSGADQLRGQKNGDVLDGGDGNDNLKGGGGNDTLFGGAGQDFLNGGSRADSIEGGDGNDNLIGRSFNDTLYGGDGNDRLNAGGEDDRVEGGSGNDLIKAGSGADVFVFGVGFELDRLVDFDIAEDRLEFLGNVAGGLDAAGIAALATQNGNSVDIDLGNGNIVRFLNTTEAELAGLENVIDIF